ncbi:MAG: hypothetical protein CBD74_11365 [Saprospirales bacterium TMED214]|nr:MAG: hypothetical protein CBD74_11365 [Saprospirales bacterium TMED214]
MHSFALQYNAAQRILVKPVIDGAYLTKSSIFVQFKPHAGVLGSRKRNRSLTASVRFKMQLMAVSWVQTYRMPQYRMPQ